MKQGNHMTQIHETNLFNPLLNEDSGIFNQWLLF